MTVTAGLRDLANTLRNPQIILGEVSDIVARGVRKNFDRSTNAGDTRPEGLDPATFEAGPDQAMVPLARFTIQQRVKDGYGGTRPLVASGRLRSEVGKHSERKRQIKVGPKTAYARDILNKQQGTFTTGIKSDITQSSIPARVVVGYGARERKDIEGVLRDLFQRKASGVTRVRIHF